MTEFDQHFTIYGACCFSIRFLVTGSKPMFMYDRHHYNTYIFNPLALYPERVLVDGNDSLIEEDGLG